MNGNAKFVRNRGELKLRHAPFYVERHEIQGGYRNNDKEQNDRGKEGAWGRR